MAVLMSIIKIITASILIELLEKTLSQKTQGKVKSGEMMKLTD